MDFSNFHIVEKDVLRVEHKPKEIIGFPKVSAIEFVTFSQAFVNRNYFRASKVFCIYMYILYYTHIIV